MIEVINRSNKKLKALQIEYKEEVKDGDIYYFAETIGKIPFVVINGINVDPGDIFMFKLINEKYLPEVEMIFSDTTNKLFDSKYPLDQQVLSIMLKSNENLLMSIRMDFWITEFKSVKNDSGDNDYKKYSLKAKLNVPYIIKHNSFKGTSYELLKKIATDADLGFASNIDNTNDSMTWINCGIDYVREQIPEVVKRSYINDNTFLWAYIDFWYNLNYIDIEKELNVDTTSDKGLSGLELLIKKNKTIPLLLSNHPDYNSTNQYIDKFSLINESTEINYEIGYNPYITYYMSKEKNMNSLLLDTISNKGKNNNNIVIKGQPDDDNYNKNQKKNYFMGKIDTDNMHENYLYAELLNINNLKFLQKIRLKVILRIPNFQLVRFQLIKLNLYKTKELDDDLNPSNDDRENRKLNKRLSGDWLIIGINFIYKKRGIYQDDMVQELTLVKRELSS